MSPGMMKEKNKENMEGVPVETCEFDDSHRGLIPGLPDDVAKNVIARLPRCSHNKVQWVSKSFKNFVQGGEFYEVRQQLGVGEARIYLIMEENLKPTYSFRVLDPRAKSCISLPPTPDHAGGSEIWEGFSCVAVGTCLFVMGGTRRSRNDSSIPGKVCGDVFKFDVKTNKWEHVSTMVPPRSWHAATAIGDSIVVAGGQSDCRFLNTAQEYNSKENTWVVLPDMSCPRHSSQGLLLDNEIWVIAGEHCKDGRNEGPTPRSSAEVYNLNTGSWRRVNDMCLDSSKVAGPISVSDGKFLCVHGTKIMTYIQRDNVWECLGNVGSSVSPQPPRQGFGFVSLDGDVYIIGGQRSMHNPGTVEVCNIREYLKSGNANERLRWRTVSPVGVSWGSKGTILASAVVQY